MRTSLRRLATCAAALVALAAPAVPALADDVVNDVPLTVDTDVRLVPLEVGDTATVTLTMYPTGGDGEPGCNVKNDGEVTFDVHSSAPSVADIEPSSVTFLTCGDKPSVTVTATEAGTADVTWAERGNNTGATFDVSAAAFRVQVTEPTPTNTPPSVAVTGVDAATYELGQAMPTPGCSVTDAEDGPSTPEPSITDGTDEHGLGTVTVTCSYTDAGGLTAESSVSYEVVDTIAPTATLLSRSPAANANGWNNSAVTVTWTCADSGSGPVDPTVSDTVETEGADQTASATCTDHAGNTTDAEYPGIDIDLTDPGVVWDGGPEDGAEYYFGFVPGAGTCTATDLLSGPAGCDVAGYSAAVGSQTLTATARDDADNEGTEQRSYTVKAWELSGFHRPVDMGAVLNTVKAGSTVPLKFEAFAGATEIADVTTLGATFSTRTIACDTQAESDAIEMTTSGGTILRYDATAGQFVQNWQTPRNPGSCYKVTLTTADASTLVAKFRLK